MVATDIDKPYLVNRHQLHNRRLSCVLLVLPLNVAQVNRQAQAMQATVPPGAPVLARMLWSHPFDFRRNPIYIADWPGMSSPGSGMPLGQGPDALRVYLLSQGIRYVFFDYHDLDNRMQPEGSGFEKQIRHVPERHRWPVIQTLVSSDVQTNLSELGSRYRKLYDDENAFVLDLSTLKTSTH